MSETIKSKCGCDINIHKKCYGFGAFPCKTCTYHKLKIKEFPCNECAIKEVLCLECAQTGEQQTDCRWQKKEGE